MRISVLNRGGLAVFGGHYDPHTNEATVLVRDGETVALVIEYPSAPTSPTKTASGVTCSTPTVVTSTNKVSATLSAMNDGGYVDISVTVAGATVKVRIRASTNTDVDGYDD